MRREHAGGFSPGVSIIIPERGTAEILSATIEACVLAVQQLTEPRQMIVVVNGCASAAYINLQKSFPGIRWLYFEEPLWYIGAIRAALNIARYDWCYLLNSDMRLDRDALRCVTQLRRADTFAISSQIFFSDPGQRREETGWTSYQGGDEPITISDDLPPDDGLVRGTLYAGGGAGLFRTSLLKQYIGSSGAYAPFYWEDVEWGWRSWRMGYSSWFCPQSMAWHIHRQTNRRLFPESEIDRIMQRNRYIFHLRNRPFCASRIELETLLEPLDPESREEILQPRRMALIARGRFECERISSLGREPGQVWKQVRV